MSLGPTIWLALKSPNTQSTAINVHGDSYQQHLHHWNRLQNFIKSEWIMIDKFQACRSLFEFHAGALAMPSPVPFSALIKGSVSPSFTWIHFRRRQDSVFSLLFIWIMEKKCIEISKRELIQLPGAVEMMFH